VKSPFRREVAATMLTECHPAELSPDGLTRQRVCVEQAVVDCFVSVTLLRCDERHHLQCK
jgi:hypothetical protein